MSPEETTGRVLVEGQATGSAAVLSAPLSLWGGFDPVTGVITDVHHPQHGRSIANTILVMTSGRGSSSASSVLAEAVRLGTSPAGFVLTMADEILVLGSVVGHELYDTTTPVLVVEPATHAQIVDGAQLTIGLGGRLSPG
ncbi:UNVERIFIED_CONTAM: hypothetical protein GTU68_046399 [Idotea baltica]|nr:hypothetical protein [Idotea baltica]